MAWNSLRVDDAHDWIRIEHISATARVCLAAAALAAIHLDPTEPTFLALLSTACR